MLLKTVNIIGSKYFHVFKVGVSKIEIETTQADYEQLGQKNPTNPTHVLGMWIHSYARNKFDTVTGDLNVGEIAYYPSGKRLDIVHNDGSVRAIDSKFVVNKELTNPNVLEPRLINL